MEFLVKGNLNKKYFKEVEDKLKKLLPMPEYIEKIFVIDHVKHASLLFKDFPKNVRKKFLCTFEQEKASMAFTYKDIEVVIILISPSDSYLKKNMNACMGILAHELTHVFQKREGINEYLDECFKHNFDEYYKKLLKLKYPPAETEKLAVMIGEAALFVLKDFYMASELINRGLGDYLLEAYYWQFVKPMKSPVFYKDFRTATKEELLNAINFELALISVILPFQSYQNPKAKKLIDYIQRRYEKNVQEIVKEFYGLDRIYDIEFSWSWDFQRKYFTKIFDDVLELLSGK